MLKVGASKDRMYRYVLFVLGAACTRCSHAYRMRAGGSTRSGSFHHGMEVVEIQQIPRAMLMV